MPASRRSSVVLPTPLTPTSPARAPSSSVSERLANSGETVRSVPFSMSGPFVLRTRHAGARAETGEVKDATPPHARPEAGSESPTVRWLATSPRRRVGLGSDGHKGANRTPAGGHVGDGRGAHARLARARPRGPRVADRRRR